MQQFTVMNYEQEGAYALGRITTDHNGHAVLALGAEKHQRSFANLNAALAAVREQCGWPNAYLVRGAA